MKPLLLVLALAAGLALACGGTNSDDTGSVASIGSAGSLGSAPGVDAAPGAVVESTVARLVVTSQVELEVADLRAAYRETADATRSLGGFVAESRIASDAEPDNGDETSSSTAFLRLRVPAEQHDALLTRLRETASRVRSEATNAKEVTGEYTDLQSRLANLRRSEAQYQELLGRAGSIEEVLDVTERLDGVRGEIEQVQGRIVLLADQSDFATVSVTLSLPPPVADSASGGLPSPATVFVDAAEGSVTVVHALVNVAAVLLVGALWLAPAGLAYLVLRRPVARLIAASRARLS